MNESDMIRMLTEDNRRLREAGTEMAIAAMRVSTEYDGTHRLMLAVSKWAEALADEGGRGRTNDLEKLQRATLQSLKDRFPEMFHDELEIDPLILFGKEK